MRRRAASGSPRGRCDAPHSSTSAGRTQSPLPVRVLDPRFALESPYIAGAGALDLRFAQRGGKISARACEPA